MDFTERRSKILHMRDLGRSDTEIIASLTEVPIRTRQRDLAAIRKEDEGKNGLELASEKIIRLAQAQLADPALPPTARAKALQTLHKAELDRLRASGEVMAVPGRGNVTRAEPQYGDGGDDDDDGIDHETDLYDWHVSTRGPDNPENGIRRAITWIKDFDPGEPERPTAEEPYILPNVEHFCLPRGLSSDAGRVIDQDGHVVGTFNYEDGDSLPPFTSFLRE
jgi:hypothetical protein